MLIECLVTALLALVLSVVLSVQALQVGVLLGVCGRFHRPRLGISGRSRDDGGDRKKGGDNFDWSPFYTLFPEVSPA